MFDFIKKVLNDKKAYPEYKQVEKLRARLLKDSSVLQVEDLGAGSKKSRSPQRSVAEICRNTSKSPRLGKLLFRIARYYKPRVIVELGTSLGISTSYLALAHPSAALYSIEGSTVVATRAKYNLATLDIHNTVIREGNFDTELPGILEGLTGVDLAFVDGNHRREPTLQYFNRLLSASHEGSIFIFDDIHWSEEMEAAWHTIQQHPAVTMTIDLFFFGIVLFRPEFRIRQHFVIRF